MAEEKLYTEEDMFSFVKFHDDNHRLGIPYPRIQGELQDWGASGSKDENQVAARYLKAGELVVPGDVIQISDDDLSVIHIENCQIKSFQKLTRLCDLLDEMEIEFGIRSVLISFRGNFVCSDIDLNDLAGTPMRETVKEALIQAELNAYGEDSKYYIAPELC